MHEQPKKEPRAERPAPRRSRWRRAGILLLVGLALLVAVRAALPIAVRWYVNRTLDQNQLYDGLIGDVDLHLWRGAYSIEDVRLLKTTGNVPVPFFAAPRVDFAIEWRALLSGEVVGRIVMQRPEMNFVDAEDPAAAQTGAGGPWLEVIKDLFPFKINSCEVRDGSVHFRAFHTEPPVDVYLSKVQGSIENLTNIHDETTPLFAVVKATAEAMDEARLEYEMKLDTFSYRPTFRLAVRLLGLDVTETNALVRAYGDFDFEQGWFDLVIELDAKEGRVEGYVKPLFRNLEIFDARRDAKVDLLAVFWEALVGVVAAVFKNHPRDQLATVIPVRGDLSGPQTDFLAAVGNLLRNAFVRAYLPRFQGTSADPATLTFGPGSLPEPITSK